MERRLAAILVADVVGYTALMGEDESGTLRRLTELRQRLLEPLIAKHHGRVVKLMGDGLLIEFASVVDALTCAAAWQTSVAEEEVEVDEDKRFLFRIGINLGDVIVEGEDIHGDGVNIAARLEGLAEPGGIYLSGDAYRHTKGKVEVDFEDLGERELKNIPEGVRVYRVTTNPSAAGASQMAKSTTPPDEPSIAVLPFTNMSGDPEQEYFSDGITEDIITELSRFRWLLVIARNSSFHYKGQSPKIQDVGHELGVRYVVEGSVRKAGNRVRITAQLIDSTSENHIWAERYDRELEDIFAVQDEVTQAIVSTVAGRLASAGPVLSKRKHPKNLTAYELVLRAREHFQRNTKLENSLARDLFQQATELDPEYALAHVWLGWTHFYDYELGWGADPEESSRLGLSCVRRGIELDSTDAWAQAGLAYSYTYSRKFDLGEAHIEKATKLNPNDADILALKGLFLSFLGRHEEGVESLEMAHLRNPFGLDWYLWCLGIALYSSGRHDEAVAAWSEMPNTPTEIFACLAAGYAQLGQFKDARKCLADYLERSQVELADFPGEDREGWRRYWFKSFPYKNTKDLDHLLDGLRKAGLPV